MNNIQFKIIEIIIAAVSAIATFSAVVVALWQTKYSNKKKVKIKTAETIIYPYHVIGKAGQKLYPKFLSITVVNIGNRKIVLQSYGLYFSKTYKIIACNLAKSSQQVLEVEGSAKYDLQISEFVKTIKSEAQNIKRTSRKLKVFIEDSSGRVYVAKSKRTIRQYMNLDHSEMFVQDS